jgi:hypothetical protein
MRERYGTDNPRRRIVIVVATTVLAMVFLAWVAWVAIFHSSQTIDTEVTAYKVVNAHRVDVKLNPELRDDKVKGTCLIRATAPDHSIVGELNITAAQLRSSAGQWIPIRTERRATTVEKVRCSED